jgi:hypothetical protein
MLSQTTSTMRGRLASKSRFPMFKGQDDRPHVSKHGFLQPVSVVVPVIAATSMDRYNTCTHFFNRNRFNRRKKAESFNGDLALLRALAPVQRLGWVSGRHCRPLHGHPECPFFRVFSSIMCAYFQLHVQQNKHRASFGKRLPVRTIILRASLNHCTCCTWQYA